jgi:tetratricopeptide (TPR) repeat protein
MLAPIDRVLDVFLLWLADSIVRPVRPRPRFGWLISIADWMLYKAGGNGAYSAGRRYVEMGRPDAAEVAFGDAQQVYERQLGPTHPYVGFAAERRGWCCAKLGRYAEAVTFYERAVAVAEISPGRDSERYAILRDTLDEVRSRLDASD